MTPTIALPFKNTTNVRVNLPYRAKALKGGQVPWKVGYHPGIDLVNTKDKTIVACADGVVIRSELNKSWGSYIVIKHKQLNLSSIYAHLSQRFVGVNRKVKRGDSIGIMGATGQVTGAHLHFELQAKYYDATSTVNPAPLMGIDNRSGKVRLNP